MYSANLNCLPVIILLVDEEAQFDDVEEDNLTDNEELANTVTFVDVEECVELALVEDLNGVVGIDEEEFETKNKS